MQLLVERPLIVIVGPTAVGKTELSIRLATDLNGEIISADSRLFYQGMDIGTAKPSREELDQVRHHLVDVANIDDIWSLALFQKSVYRIADDIRKREKIPFLVGGTGQYIRAILEGWSVPELPPNNNLRLVIEKWGNIIGSSVLHDKLTIIDPNAAENIERNNMRRIVRALEVIFSTGRLFSSQRKRNPINFQYKMIGLKRDRKELYARIDERIMNMFDTGFIDEVKEILAKGYDKNLPSLSAIGYKEVIEYLNEEIDKSEVIRLMKRRTRQYVRRQANWFKDSDPKIRWFQMGKNILDEVTAFIYSSDGWIVE